MGLDGYDDLQRLRNRRNASRTPTPGSASSARPAIVGQVTTAVPAVGKFCLVNPVVLFGAESEGSPRSISVPDTPARVAVYILGPAAPVTGDYLVCHHVDYRWVAERMTTGGSGTGGPILPFCFCDPLPGTLTMFSADPTCNFGMFQSGTIQYGPTPAEYADLDIGVNSFLGVESFPDVTANGALFRYLLTCLNNQFNLSRVYLESPYGSPYRDGLLYTWLTGGPGNTCNDSKTTPSLHLNNGVAYAGSDQSCFVTINGGP